MVFPAPLPRETIASYGYRIARLSGLSSLTDLGHLFDLDIRALLEGDRISVRALARYAGCDDAQLGQGRLDARNPHRLRIGFDPRAMVQSNPRSFRVCPLCLQGLTEGDFAATCLGRTDWLVAANHVCAEHQVRLVQVTPSKPARVHRDLAPLIPLLERAQHLLPRPEPATALERHITGCLDGTLVPSWAGDLQLDVFVHTAEIFGALAMRGAQADWSDISGEERRRQGHIGAQILVQGVPGIKAFLAEHIGTGRRGNDYRYAFGQAFDLFYFRRSLPTYRPVCEVLADYVGETFRFTGQEKVFGIQTRGIAPKTLRALCTHHGIGVKITAQVLNARYGLRAGASAEVPPDLIAELAPVLRDLLNAQDAARALGVSIDVLKGLIADGLLLPDYQFNDRMRGFSRETLDRFLAEWCTGTKAKRGQGAKIALLALARSRCVRTSRLLLAVRALGVPLLRDARRHGLAGVFVAEADTVALLRQIREQVGA